MSFAAPRSRIRESSPKATCSGELNKELRLDYAIALSTRSSARCLFLKPE
jgi:hypothetical protein